MNARAAAFLVFTTFVFACSGPSATGGSTTSSGGGSQLVSLVKPGLGWKSIVKLGAQDTNDTESYSLLYLEPAGSDVRMVYREEYAFGSRGYFLTRFNAQGVVTQPVTAANLYIGSDTTELTPVFFPGSDVIHTGYKRGETGGGMRREQTELLTFPMLGSETVRMRAGDGPRFIFYRDLVALHYNVDTNMLTRFAFDGAATLTGYDYVTIGDTGYRFIVDGFRRTIEVDRTNPATMSATPEHAGADVLLNEPLDAQDSPSQFGWVMRAFARGNTIWLTAREQPGRSSSFSYWRYDVAANTLTNVVRNGDFSSNAFIDVADDGTLFAATADAEGIRVEKLVGTAMQLVGSPGLGVDENVTLEGIRVLSGVPTIVVASNHTDGNGQIDVAQPE